MQTRSHSWILSSCLWLVPLLAVAAPTQPKAKGVEPLTVLACEPASGNHVLLKMIMFGTEPQDRVRLEFVADGLPYEGQAPRPRSASAALKCAGRVEVVRFGPFVLDEHVPRELHVRGGVVEGRPHRLGTITRSGSKEEPTTFRRHFPLLVRADDEHQILVAASSQRLGPRRFIFRVAYFNCGESFESDLSAFVHFEFAAKGENLAEPCELKLFPRSERIDTSTWRPDEVTVVRFEPFEIPTGAPETVYVRAGIYDQFGTKERLPIAGSDDGTGRVLVGRFVRRRGMVSFERLCPYAGKGAVP